MKKGKEEETKGNGDVRLEGLVKQTMVSGKGSEESGESNEQTLLYH